MSQKSEDKTNPNSSEVVQVVPYSIDVKGCIRAMAFYQYSDLNLKTNIEDLTDAIDIISNLKGRRYEWKKGLDDNLNCEGGKKVIGLIAQEVERVLPELVAVDKETGLLSINYTDIVPILIEAFKQHIAQYKNEQGEMKLEMNELRQYYPVLKEKLDHFEKKYL